VPHQPSAEPMIAARDLRKSFTGRDGTVVEAVKGIDIEVRRGEAFGFLGPNGAGKSSTMRMIAAVSPVSGGELRILGMDPAEHGPAIRSRLGVCPQEDTLDNELNVFDNLYIYGRYFGIAKREVRERADELLEFVQLTEKRTAKVEDLSGGMKRRLTIARSLINRPDILLLDEPTTGLDPQARHVLWDRLFRLKQQGVKIDGIAVRDSPEGITAFLDRNGNPYERIGSDQSSRVQLSLGSSGVPETFVVDGRGVIRFQFVGPIGSADVPMVMKQLEEAK